MKIPVIKTKLSTSILYTSYRSETCYFDFEIYFDDNKIDRYFKSRYVSLFKRVHGVIKVWLAPTETVLKFYS